MSRNKKRKDSPLEKALSSLVDIFAGVASEALTKLKSKKFEFWILATSILVLCFGFGAGLYHLRLLGWIAPSWFDSGILAVLTRLPIGLHGFSIVALTVSIALSFYGWKAYFKRRSYQEKLELIDFKNAKGINAKISKVIELNDFKSKLILAAPGIGKERFQAKKSDLQAAFGMVVEKIDHGKSPSVIQIDLTSKSLPSLCHYEDLISNVKKPYNFLIGESLSGVETKCIRDLPHMLIAGTTGGGKSVFFKQALLSLLENSPHIQMFLLDLKSGVEMKEFGDLPNVKVAKTESEAVSLLRAVKNEMSKRFKYLERKGYKSIEPARDKMDILIVGTDEASVLYGLSKGARADNQSAQTARKLTDDLAKLSRAAGIHLIFATQKVTQASIDTKVQENLEGRMVFRMNTLQGSLTVLGNKTAMDLPDIKGRAIWSSGSKNIQVQAPYISDNALCSRLEVLLAEWSTKKREMLQPNLLKEETRSISDIAEHS